MGGEKEPVPRSKKWPLGSLLAPGAEVIQGLYIDAEPTDMDHGDLTDIEVTRAINRRFSDGCGRNMSPH